MAMLDSVESFTIKPERVFFFPGQVGDRFAAWFRMQRKYRAVRRELFQYSPHELIELGIREADIDTVAMAVARGEPTRCRLVETKQKRLLTGG